MNQETESQRILAEYERRSRVIPSDFYELHRLPNLFHQQEHERMLARCLQRTGHVPLSSQRMVELGCGSGNWLRVFEGLGVQPENLAGIELGADRADISRRRFPQADVRTGDATSLPWPDGTFDIAFQRMMFSSILDGDARRQAAGEMMRVLRPDGVIVWVDFFINPSNPHVRPIGKREILALFPGWRGTFYRTTLAPPLVRRLVPISWNLARVLESLRVLNTFYIATLCPGHTSA